jgi:hypothetical protein
MIKVKQKVRFTRSNAGRRRIVDSPPGESPTPAGRVPRVAKLMALAIRFDDLLRDGVVSDQSELARLAKVTQPRMTQIMNLLHLDARIQEELLFLPKVEAGRDPIHEKLLRPIAAEVSWRKQREMWAKLRAERGA